MPYKIAVTGASGHIGNVVCRMLIEKGYQVKAFYHSDIEALEGLPLELVKGDILNLTDVASLVEGCTLVINCAAIISIDGDKTGLVFRTNTEGPKNVLEASIQKGVKRIIHVSSVHAVHDLPHEAEYNETRPYKGQDDFVYDYSKAMGEQYMLPTSKKNAIEVVVVRPSCVVGPFDFKPSMIGKVLMDWYQQKMIAIPEGGYDLVDVRDISESICQAITHGGDGEIYLLSGKYYSFKEMVKMVCSIRQKNVPTIVIPFWMLTAAIPFAWLYSKIKKSAPFVTRESIVAIKEGHPGMDNAKARQALGHRVRPLEETLRDFFDWHQNYKTSI